MLPNTTQLIENVNGFISIRFEGPKFGLAEQHFNSKGMEFETNHFHLVIGGNYT